MVSPPTHTGNNEACNPRSALKSACKNQAQSKQVRIGTSTALHLDVVDVSYNPSEDGNPPKQSVRLTRSKDVKLKGVSGAQENSEVGMKGHRNEKVPKKMKATRGGTSKGYGTKDATGYVTSAGGGTKEGGTLHGGDVEDGKATEKVTLSGSEMEGHGGSGGVEERNKGGGTRGSPG